MWRLPSDLTIKTNDEKNTLVKPRPVNRQAIVDSYSTIETGISIDKKGTVDIDDIFWIEPIKDKKETYKLCVYIPDVTYYVKSNSVFEKEAKKQLETIYDNVTKKVTLMLPSLFSIQNLRMTEGVVRRCLKFEFIFSENKKPLLKSISKCQAKNIKSYSYEDVNKILQNVNRSCNTECTLDMAKDITYLFHKKRKQDGNLNTKNPKAKQNFVAENIITELMVICNQEIGKFFKKNNLSGLFLNTKETIDSVVSYYTTEAQSNTIPYVTITSPIRKYADMINHRILKSFLSKRRKPYSNSELELISKHINNIKYKNYKTEKAIVKKDEEIFNLDEIRAKLNNNQYAKIKEIAYLIFETDETDLTNKIMEQMKNNILVAYGVLKYHSKKNDILITKNNITRDDYVLSYIHVGEGKDMTTHEYFGIGFDEEESVYNACYQYLFDYVNSNLQKHKTDYSFDMIRYLKAKEVPNKNQNEEIVKKRDLGQLHTNIKTYITNFLQKGISPSMILVNLQYKFKPVIKDISFKTELDTSKTTIEYIFNISGRFLDEDLTTSLSGTKVTKLKEDCSLVVLNMLLERI